MRFSLSIIIYSFTHDFSQCGNLKSTISVAVLFAELTRDNLMTAVSALPALFYLLIFG